MCSQNNYQQVKIGYTSVQDPHAYLVNSYGRPYVPLEVVSVIAVGNAKLLEKVLHYFLAPKRLHNRHEVFNMASASGGFETDAWQSAIQAIQTIDNRSGYMIPESYETLLNNKRQRDDERTTYLAKRKIERAEKAKNIRQIEAQARAEKKAAQQKELEQNLADERARKVAEEEDEARKQVELEAKCQLAIKTYLAENVEEGSQRDYVKVKELFNSFAAANRSLQQDKKSKKSEVMFRLAAIKHLHKGLFKEMHGYRENGKVITSRNVILGYKRKAVVMDVTM